MNLPALIEHVKYLVSQDETLLALKCLDMVPAYYRENYPKELLDLKKKISSMIITPYDLVRDEREHPKPKEEFNYTASKTIRGLLLGNEIRAANPFVYLDPICFEIWEVLRTHGCNYVFQVEYHNGIATEERSMIMNHPPEAFGWILLDSFINN